MAKTQKLEKLKAIGVLDPVDRETDTIEVVIETPRNSRRR